MHCVFFSAFRMIPYPLEKGHLFYPYPICTETADRELLPCMFNVFLPMIDTEELFTWVLQRSLLWCLLNWVHWIRITRLTVSLWSSCDGSRGSSSAQFITIGCIYYFWQLTDRERDYQEDPNQLDLAILSCQDTDLSSRLTSHQTKSTVSQPC